jgi:hypothetical protein
MNGKYIIIDADGLSVAITFPNIVQHSQAVNRNQVTILSAGQFEVVGGELKAFGGSLSLGISSRPGDAGIIKESLFLAGLKNFCPQTVGV